MQGAKSNKMNCILEDKVNLLPDQSFRNGRIFLQKGGIRLGVEKYNTHLFEQIQTMLESVKYGSITLVVQDGKVIQIEKNEKVRLK
jgi:hypothetical protein